MRETTRLPSKKQQKTFLTEDSPAFSLNLRVPASLKKPHSRNQLTNYFFLPWKKKKKLYRYWEILTQKLYTMMWMLRALWLVVAHDLSEYRYMDDVTRNLFSLFCSTWRVVLNMFVRLSRIKASEILENVQLEPFTSKKNGETGTKRALDYFRMSKL